jgi:hypothetical protein
VHIVLVMVGHVVVDHQHQLLHIQPTCCHAGGHQDVAHIGLEVGNGGLTVALVLAAVEGQARVARLGVGDKWGRGGRDTATNEVSVYRAGKRVGTKSLQGPAAPQEGVQGESMDREEAHNSKTLRLVMQTSIHTLDDSTKVGGSSTAGWQ